MIRFPLFSVLLSVMLSCNLLSAQEELKLTAKDSVSSSLWIFGLGFNFVDDTTTVDPNQTSIPVETTPAEDFHNRADLRTQDAIDNDVDVHQEASMIVEATPELHEKFEQEDDTDEYEF